MRSLISQNMGYEEFLFYVSRCLESEFKLKSQIKIQDYEVVFKLGDYEILFTLVDVKENKEKSPYSLDRFILDRLQKEGFEFDKEKSLYIKYCYNQ